MVSLCFSWKCKIFFSTPMSSAVPWGTSLHTWETEIWVNTEFLLKTKPICFSQIPRGKK
jgi:hypothetical protein